MNIVKAINNMLAEYEQKIEACKATIKSLEREKAQYTRSNDVYSIYQNCCRDSARANVQLIAHTTAKSDIQSLLTELE